MFSIERWQEVFETISKNKLRTFLTGVSVASGIFILVILLGVGKGMQNGVEEQFEQDATNRISIYTGVTKVEYKGMNPGRRIQLKNDDYQFIDENFGENLEYQSSVYRIWGSLASYKNNSGNYRIEGVYPDNQFLENASIIQGRFINQNDLKNKEKHIAIGRKVRDDLFKDEDPVGKLVEISNLKFKVVGVYTDPGGEREETRLFLPITTAQSVFGGGNNISYLAFTLPKEDDYEVALKKSNAFVNEVSTNLKAKHTVAPNDDSAISINNSLENAKQFYDLNNIIRLFFWGVGVMTLLAGIVGVSNIMLIIVKERTKEIGIRKAIGAQPMSIVGMVLHESIFVTTISGFFGLIFALFLLEFVGPFIESEFITNPSVDFNVAISTVILLVISGAVAGFFPAWRGARIKPIDALRDE
ncbi:ABC transporter permease [Psychroflexus aestuariivivens]|uniref:ABC transporter permease n=1 Tax=Psychroflexus aestuariivivens TaxID=1795040 RepID=UPI000FD82329|nr:ABC transporter permease [Psychroflexus aestuariivivens]